MQIVTTFNPAVTTSDTFTVPQNSANGKMVVWNESNISIQLSFQNGDTAYVPAWTARLFCGEYGGVNVTWVQHSVLTSNQPPLSQVVVETHGSDESLPGTFPATLSRQTNIGNAATVLTAATSIQNDGNNAGTSLIEATVVGDASSAVTLTNNAIMVLGDTTNAGSLTTNGPVTMNKSLTVQGASHGASTTLDGGPPNVQTDGSGNVTLASVIFTVGSISHIAKFSAAVTNVATFFNHNLGAVPDIILMSISDLHTTLHQVTYEAASMTNTQVKLQADASFNITGLAIKF